MKKKLSIVSLLLTVVLALCAFAACTRGTAKVSVLENTQELLVIQADETKTDVSVGDVMQNLKDNGEIEFEADETEFGLYILSVNGRAASDNEYWAVYTSLASYDGVIYSSTDYGSYTYDGKECGYANYGVDGLPVIEGEIYILVLESY